MQASDPNQRIIRSAIIMLLLVLTLLPASRQLLFEGHFFSYLDARASAYVDAGLVRAGAAFATARSFNALISVFRESDLQLEPGGVGVSLALGAALDPANDLIERFSWIMLASLTSLGVQKVLIEITPFISVQLVLLLSLLSLLAGLWLREMSRFDFSRLGRMLLLAAILLRFAVPVMACLNQQVYVAFLEDRHAGSMEALGQTVKTLENQQLKGLDSASGLPDAPGAAAGENWWERTRNRVSETVDQGKKSSTCRLG